MRLKTLIIGIASIIITAFYPHRPHILPLYKNRPQILKYYKNQLLTYLRLGQVATENA
jgi:hypothetical protein